MGQTPAPRGRAALVLGGAGFLGSHIARRLIGAGWRVAIIDGLLPRCGGDERLLEDILGVIEFTVSRLEEVDDLQGRLRDSDLVVDCMGWTRHREGLADPLHDMELNLACHLHLLASLPREGTPRVIYLGSRGQYGHPKVDVIDEDTPMAPGDVQGIHKAAAETHFRINASLWDLDAVSLRLPNCFGPGQLLEGEDIGLLGGFIRDFLAGRVARVYGGGRARHLAFARDVAWVVERLAQDKAKGFRGYNYAGQRVTLAELLELLRKTIGRGGWLEEPMPGELAVTDAGDTLFTDSRLHQVAPGLRQTDLAEALRETVAYFQSSRS